MTWYCGICRFMGKPASQEDLLKAKKQPDVQSIAALVRTQSASMIG